MIQRQSKGLLKGPSQKVALNLVVLKFTQTCLSTQLKTNTYVADIEKDKTEDASCSKAFNSKVDTTGGKTRLSCELNIVKGFTALYEGDSALQVLFTFESMSLMSFFSNFNVFLFKL